MFKVNILNRYLQSMILRIFQFLETPILHGEDARVFEARMKNPPKESREKMEEINRDYNYIMSLFAN